MVKPKMSPQTIPHDTCEAGRKLKTNTIISSATGTNRSIKRIAPLDDCHTWYCENKYPKLCTEVPSRAISITKSFDYHPDTTIPSLQMSSSDESRTNDRCSSTSPIIDYLLADIGSTPQSLYSPNFHPSSLSKSSSDENNLSWMTTPCSPAATTTIHTCKSPLSHHFSVTTTRHDFLGKQFFSPGIQTPATSTVGSDSLDMISPIGEICSL
jgi:hypothetical protein